MKWKITSKSCQACVDSLGAQLVSLQNADGTQYLWQGDPRYWAEQSPLLFPMVGRLRGGKTRIGAREYTMGCHGFAKEKEFRLTMQEENALSFVLCSDSLTKEQYPFDFCLTTSYRLEGARLSVSLEVENQDSTVMPFALGGHPGFCVPLENDGSFEDYEIEFEKKETASCPLVTEQGLIDFTKCSPVLVEENTIPLRHDLFVPDALVFENLKSRRVALKNRMTGRGVQLDFDGFPYLGIWSTGDASFVALEPWTGCADSPDSSGEFAEKRGMRFLLPAEKAKYTYQITML